MRFRPTYRRKRLEEGANIASLDDESLLRGETQELGTRGYSICIRSLTLRAKDGIPAPSGCSWVERAEFMRLGQLAVPPMQMHLGRAVIHHAVFHRAVCFVPFSVNGVVALLV